MSSPKRRIETDVMKMLMSDYEVTLVNDNMQEFYVRFKGPEESKYHLIADCQITPIIQANQHPAAPFLGGLWKIHVELPDQYPYKSPSIGFVNRIFHPNIDELYGSPTPFHHVTKSPLTYTAPAPSVSMSSTRPGHQCTT